MLTGYKRLSVIAGFAVLLAVLVANAFFTGRRLRVQVANQAWVAHTREVLSDLEVTQSLLQDAETGQRGYLLTGELKYLAPYNSAVTQIDPHLKTLADLTADNPAEQANAAQLGTLAHQKLDELKRTVGLYHSGNTRQTQAIVLSDHGRLLMENIRGLTAEMRREETHLEATRTAAYRESIQATGTSIVLATLLGALGLIVLAYFVFRENALRDRHTHELRVREEWFRVMLTSIGDAVIATDRNGKVTFCNPVAEALTGIKTDAAIGKDILTIFPVFNEISGKPADNPVTKVMQLGRVVGLANHTVIKHADGRMIPIEDSAAPIRDDNKELIGVVLAFRDVSAERKSQDLVRKTEKLAAAARLSATVAHEINNPLEAVVNLIFIAKTDPGTPAAVLKHLTLAEQEIERVAHITRQTLGFYRESNAPEAIQINSLLESILNVYSNKLESSGIRVQCHFTECPPILGVAGELRQAFSNLLANAIDAAGENGQIIINSQGITGSGGDAVEVVIADSGSGITAEHLDRIFEPFFTTKKDTGTGLGLWVTKEIVERHDGTIQVRPSHGGKESQGAAFVLRLPSAPILAPSENTSSTIVD
jgi:PAS domain S-box-containing protein